MIPVRSQLLHAYEDQHVKSLSAITCLVMLTACFQAAAQTTITLSPTSDTYVQSGTPTTNYAYEPLLLARLADAEGLTRASFLQFSLAGLPAGTITSARLRLYGRHEAPSGSGFPISIWPGTLTTTWSGPNVNYNNSSTVTGVDFYNTSSIATTTVGITPGVSRMGRNRLRDAAADDRARHLRRRGQFRASIPRELQFLGRHGE